MSIVYRCLDSSELPFTNKEPAMLFRLLFLWELFLWLLKKGLFSILEVSLFAIVSFGKAAFVKRITSARTAAKKRNSPSIPR